MAPSSSSSSSSSFTHALDAYVSVRGAYMKNSLQPLTQSVADVAARVQSGSMHGPREALVEYQRGSARFQPWLEALVQMAENEYAVLAGLLTDVAPANVLRDAFTEVLRPTLTYLATVLAKVLPRTQHGLNAHRLVQLDFLAATMAAFGPDAQRWTSVLQAANSPPTDTLDAVANAYKDSMLFFPEFIRDVKVIPVQREHDTFQAGVSDIARLGTKLLQGLAAYGDVVQALLHRAGQRNWTPSGAQYPPPSGDASQDLYAEFATDLLASVVMSLERVFSAMRSTHRRIHRRRSAAHRRVYLPAQVRMRCARSSHAATSRTCATKR